MDVFFTNLGCKLNQAEIEAMARDFAAAGHRVVGSLEAADLHVINSCTVTHVAARSSRKTARRGSRMDRDRPLRTVLTGCYASGSPEEAARLAGVDLVVPNTEKAEILPKVHGAFPELRPRRRSSAEGARAADLPYTGFEGGHTRAMVKIGDGCNMRCSFCIIPFTRGRETSRPLADVVAEVDRLVAAGFREVVLTGVQITHWRVGGLRLHDLARAVLDRTAIERLRLTSIASWDFEPALFEIFEESRVCRHVHMSLQSGSTGVLTRMRRAYSAPDYAAVLAELRRRVGGPSGSLAVTTDVIVGFPGETEEEHAESLAFVRRAGFARVHAFPYSVREGTHAAGLPDRVPHDVQRRRMAEMLAAADDAARAFADAHVGRTVEVLWERREADGRWMGLSDNYLKVWTRSPLPPTAELRNRVTPFEVTGLASGGDGAVGRAMLPGATERTKVEHSVLPIRF